MAAATPVQTAEVRGYLHRPQQGTGAGLLLAHGAGSNCNAPLLVAVADAFCAAGLAVLRIDLPFRQRRPTGPPSPHGAAEDRAGLRRAVAELREIVPGRVVMGGHSYGGRQATMLAADEPALADALLLLSYPLHPPAKPTQLRTEHFPRLRLGAVFVHGTTDPFGSIDEMQAAVSLIPAHAELLPIAGAGHDLKRGRFDLDQIVRAAAAIGG